MRIIAGPCKHESLSHSFDIAKECKRVCDLFDIEYIFKASFDKANRTSISGKRGVGMEATLLDFITLKDKLNTSYQEELKQEVERMSWYSIRFGC